MSLGEDLSKTASTREHIDTILADEALAEMLPEHVGWFILRREPVGRNKRLSEIVGLLKDYPIVLRSDFVDDDDERLRLRAIDLLRPLAFLPEATDRDLEELVRQSISGLYNTSILLDIADGEIELFRQNLDLEEQVLAD